MKKILIISLSFILVVSCRQHLPKGEDLKILPETKPSLISVREEKTIGIWVHRKTDSIFVLVPTKDQYANLLYMKIFHTKDTIFIEPTCVSLPDKRHAGNYFMDKPAIKIK